MSADDEKINNHVWWNLIEKITIISHNCCMMTSSNGNIFRVTGPLCGEFTGHRWIPRTKARTRSFDVFFDLRLNLRVKWTIGRLVIGDAIVPIMTSLWCAKYSRNFAYRVASITRNTLIGEITANAYFEEGETVETKWKAKVLQKNN